MLKEEQIKRGRRLQNLIGEEYEVKYVGEYFVVGEMIKGKVCVDGQEVAFLLEEVINSHSAVIECKEV